MEWIQVPAFFIMQNKLSLSLIFRLSRNDLLSLCIWDVRKADVSGWSAFCFLSSHLYCWVLKAQFLKAIFLLELLCHGFVLLCCVSCLQDVSCLAFHALFLLLIPWQDQGIGVNSEFLVKEGKLRGSCKAPLPCSSQPMMQISWHSKRMPLLIP